MAHHRRWLLAQRRKAVGLSQDGLTERLGVDRSTVVRWESGRARPRPWLRPLLADALQLTIDQLDDLLDDLLEARTNAESYTAAGATGTRSGDRSETGSADTANVAGEADGDFAAVHRREFAGLATGLALSAHEEHRNGNVR